MAKFNLEDYETVEQRISRFMTAFPDGRIITENLTTEQDRTVGMWVVKAKIYLSDSDQDLELPKATGHAFEIDGQGMAQQTAGLETCETSAIGRALANMAMSGNRRTSREEMEKAERGITPKRPRDWVAEAEKLTTIKELRLLWTQAKAAKAPADVLKKVEAIGSKLTDGLDSGNN
jgi:hypothetical protein